MKLTKYADEPASLYWPKDTEDKNRIVMPGDNVEMEVETLLPIAVEPGQRFSVREGGRTVATGLVSRVIS